MMNNSIDQKVDKYLNEGVGSWAKGMVVKALNKGKRYLYELVRDIMYSALHETIREIQYKLSSVNTNSTTSRSIDRKVKQLSKEAKFHQEMYLEILEKLGELNEKEWNEDD
jgi:hypothetical protein